MILRPSWVEMIAPRAVMLVGLVLLFMWAGQHSDVLFWLGLVAMAGGLIAEGVFRLMVRCPKCGHSPYVPAPFTEFPVIRQPLVPAPTCPNCGYEFE